MPFRRINQSSSFYLPSPSCAVPSARPISPRARLRPPLSPVAPDTPSAARDAPSEQQTPPRRKHHIVDRSGPNWDENGDYIVGKGRPPQQHRWLPKQSGNPRGPKRREQVDPQTELENTILAEFPTIVNGEPQQINLGVFALNLLKAKAAQKDRKAAEVLLDLYRTTLRARAPRPDDDQLLPEEQAMIEALLDGAGWIDPVPVRNAHRSAEEDEASDG